jgi:hypothetical protein
MQQRQLRLGDILDDYCPRERRLTNHAVVAMVGDEVKQTRCTTCDTEHDYKHAKVPRQRRKSDTPAALHAGGAGGPKRVPHEQDVVVGSEIHDAQQAHGEATPPDKEEVIAGTPESVEASTMAPASQEDDVDDVEANNEAEEGPVHRPLIRATLPRPEGQPPPTRPGPDFTIRQPGGRQNRFRSRHQRGGQQFFGDRSNGNMGGGNSMRGGMPRHGGGRPPQGSMTPRGPRRQDQGPGRKRSK